MRFVAWTLVVALWLSADLRGQSCEDPSATLTLGMTSMPPGTVGVEIPVIATSSCPLSSLSFAIGHDPELLQLTDVRLGFEVEALSPDSFLAEIGIEGDHGKVLVILDTEEPLDKLLEATTGVIVAILTYTVSPDAPPGDVPLTNADFVFGNPPVAAVFGSEDGFDISPTLTDGTIRVVMPMAPTLDAISSTAGSTQGGENVVLSGTGFTTFADTDVTFGGVAAELLDVTATSVTVRTPAVEIQGLVDVELMNSNGTVVLIDGYNYIGPYEILGVDPLVGSTAGGTTVTISGSGFTTPEDTRVVFGALDATILSMDPQQIVVEAPAQPAGSIDVAISSSRGVLFFFDEFRFEPFFIRGDLDRVSGAALPDVIRILLWLFDPLVGAPACEDAADLQDDGRVDLADPIYLLRFIFRDGAPPPAPFPEPGPDPTPEDRHDCGTSVPGV